MSTPASQARGSRRDIPTSSAASDRPSSAVQSLPATADEVEGSVLPDEPLLQFGDGDDWPDHFGAARLGIP